VATFVRCTASIAVPFPEAKARFLDGPDAWLGPEVATALPGQAELDVLLTAGTWPMRKRVTLRMGVINDSDNAVTLPIRLEATGPKGLFPELDADLTILPVGPDRSQLVLQGSYRPPLEGFGQTLDRVALHRIAEASLQDLVARLAAKLEDACDRHRRLVDHDHAAIETTGDRCRQEPMSCALPPQQFFPGQQFGPRIKCRRTLPSPLVFN